MLLVSTTGLSQGAILDRTLRAGARPLSVGPVPGSIIVHGERRAIAKAALPAGILMLNASEELCGELL